MKQLLCLIILITLCLAVPVLAKVQVVTATQDLADIAKAIGGSNVEVKSLSRGTQDPHQVEPRPSQVVVLTRADMLVRIGMDLDLWVDGLINAARNRNITRGARGYVDASRGIRKLDVPSGRVDASHGDIHIYGNPHYWLDPENGIAIAENVMEGLIRIDSNNSAEYKANLALFKDTVRSRQTAWRKLLAPYKGTKIVTYHRTWPYFLQRFGLVSFGEVEPKPGIPPSPSHIASLAKEMKENDVKLVVVEHFYPRKNAELVAKIAGAKIIFVPVSAGGEKGADTYLEMLDIIVKRLAAALEGTK